MKAILALLSIITLATLILASGCHSITIPTPSGPATVRSFGQKTTISELQFNTNGTLRLKGYNNDQVTGLSEVVGAAAEGAAKGAKP